MWKKTSLSLLLISQSISGNDVAAQPSSARLDTHETVSLQTQHEHDRENFLQLEALLNLAIKEKRVTPTLLALSEQLKSPDYPLQEEADWLILKAKLTQITPLLLEERVKDIQQFALKYPNTAKRQQILQRPISLYFAQEKWEDLLRYTQQVPAVGIENQCRVLEAENQLLSSKSGGEFADSVKVAQDKLLHHFDTLWQTAAYPLPDACNHLAAHWLKQGFQTADKLKQKALYFFIKNQPLGEVAVDDENLKNWFSAVEALRLNPALLPTFVESQTSDSVNQAIVQHAFTAFIKTQPEQQGENEFHHYLNWADKFQLPDGERKTWLITFLNRNFDYADRSFQTWRDKQLATLQVDPLTERRLRLAILQKSDLSPWLSLLSNEAQNKQEWRYWRAKTDPTQRTALLTALSLERGFYPMLASYQLGKAYEVKWSIAEKLDAVQLQHFNPSLMRIAELRVLKRFDAAKTAWLDLIHAVDFKQKLALSDYALQQHWYDLAVEGTIQARAWDYIPLRLPNAYLDWFKLHLQGKSIRQSFAMAIARQESAWNFQAKSHANALGLMQMLPNTAKQTAEKYHLPFGNEQTLLQPFHNIMLGTAHLEELNRLYPNNRILIAAAYNAGGHRVTRWLQRAGGRLALDEFIASIPFVETRGYVQNVLAYDYYYQLLQQYPTPTPFTSEEIRQY